jgi:chromosome segregation ATPase
VQYDDISTGHRFLREPDDLTEFDPDRVRVESLIGDLGELQATLDRYQAQSADLHAQIEIRAGQIESQRQQIARCAADVERLSAALADYDIATTQLRANIAALERDCADLRASRSWKLTAPLRALWRLLGGQ